MTLSRRITFATAGSVAIVALIAAVAIHTVIRRDFEPFAGQFEMMQSMMGSAPDLRHVYALVDDILLQTLLVAVVLGIIAGLAIGRGISRSVAAISCGLSRFAAGEFEKPIAESGLRELSQIARDANAMSAQIAHSRTQERELIAGIAHDLAHPLTAMRGTLEGVRDGIVEPADSTSTSRLLDAVETMQATVEDLRDVAAFRAGRLRLEREAVDVNFLSERVVAVYRDVAARRGLRLESVTDDQITIESNERRIERIIVNLVVNALQETAPGGSIRIGVAANRTRPHLAILSVEDDAGAAAFGRLTAAFRGNEGGGLGLRVVATLAEALDATVHIERSETGPQSVDAVVCPLVLCTIENPLRALERARRLLRPDGRLVVLEHVRGEGVVGTLQDAILPVWRRITGGCRPNQDTQLILQRSGFVTNALEQRHIGNFSPMQDLLIGYATLPNVA